MKKHFSVFFLVLPLLFPAAVSAENIRGDMVKNIILNDETTGGSNDFTVNIEDIFAVSVDSEAAFISGAEIVVKVPSSLRSYSNSFAVVIYKQISPEITSGIGTYYGRKYYSLILPETSRFFIRIPYLNKLENETDPYTTVIPDLTAEQDFPLVVTILPMMKGFPSSLYSSSFGISVNPIMKESGTLSLNLKIPESLDNTELSLRIDGKDVPAEKSDFLLSTGTHNLTAAIPGGRNESRNFSIEAGRTTSLNIEIEKLESYALIEAPENSIIYLDGEKLEMTPDYRYRIEPGEHTVLFKIGDYKISKKFSVLPGKDCKISLFLDIFVEEN